MSEFLQKILSNANLWGVLFLDWQPTTMELSWFGHKFRWTARTSGIVLVAGVGSYCAYRICAKYLRKEFVWTLMDVVRFDKISMADSRLLHPAAEGYMSSRQSSTFYEKIARQRLSQLLNSLSEDERAASTSGLSVLSNSRQQSSSVSHAESVRGQKQRYRLLSTRSGSPIRVICTSNHLLKQSLQKPQTEIRESSDNRGGLSSIKQWTVEEGIEDRTLSTRRHVPLMGNEDRYDAMSDLTSVSRMQPPPDALLRTNCCVDVDGDLIDDEDLDADNFSRSSCRRSLCGEPLIWDDEFNRENTSIINPLFGCDSSSNISELSAMKNLEAMWSRADRRGRPDSSATSLILRISNDTDDVSSCCETPNLTTLIESKCSIQSANYMYHSACVDDIDEISASNEDNQSVLSATFTAQLAQDFHDLLEISTSRETGENYSNAQATKFLDADEPSSSASRLMTDSSSSSSKSQRKSAMFDSAIGTDFLSSDDDKSSLHGHTLKQAGGEVNKEDPTILLIKPSSKRGSWLERISEKGSPLHKPRKQSIVSSIAPSERSLEWCDDPYASTNHSSNKQTL